MAAKHSAFVAIYLMMNYVSHNYKANVAIQPPKLIVLLENIYQISFPLIIEFKNSYLVLSALCIQKRYTHSSPLLLLFSLENLNEIRESLRYPRSSR